MVRRDHWQYVPAYMLPGPLSCTRLRLRVARTGLWTAHGRIQVQVHRDSEACLRPAKSDARWEQYNLVGSPFTLVRPRTLMAVRADGAGSPRPARMRPWLLLRLGPTCTGGASKRDVRWHRVCVVRWRARFDGSVRRDTRHSALWAAEKARPVTRTSARARVWTPRQAQHALAASGLGSYTSAERVLDIPVGVLTSCVANNLKAHIGAGCTG